MQIEIRPFELQDWIKHAEKLAASTTPTSDINVLDNMAWFGLSLEDDDERDAIRSQLNEYLFNSRDPQTARFVVLMFYYRGALA